MNSLGKILDEAKQLLTEKVLRLGDISSRRHRDFPEILRNDTVPETTIQDQHGAAMIRKADHELTASEPEAALQKPPEYRPGPYERVMRTLSPDRPEALEGKVNVFRGRAAGGAHSVYKPGWLEHMPPPPVGRYGIPFGAGHLARREVGAYRFDEALRFGRVPPTGLADGPHGPGSNQLWETFSSPSYPLRKLKQLPPNTPFPEKMALAKRELARYPKVQREQMAVIDYVIANSDRHFGNILTDRDVGIVAIDNAYSFPEEPDPLYGIRSSFVTEFLGKDLSEPVMSRVRAVDIGQLRIALEDAGLSDKAVNGALDRLTEIRLNGKITGEKWSGPINPASFQGATGPLPSGWIETSPPAPKHTPPA